MTKMTSKYLGGLRIESTHEKSGTKMITDAPVDNNGKGSSFSPTDMLATAYMNCMMTIIGIYCDQHNLAFENGKASVEKIMKSNPRRIGQLNIEMDLSGNNWTEKEQQKIMAAGRACPVAKSVNPTIEININFKF